MSGERERRCDDAWHLNSDIPFYLRNHCLLLNEYVVYPEPARIEFSDACDWKYFSNIQNTRTRSAVRISINRNRFMQQFEFCLNNHEFDTTRLDVYACHREYCEYRTCSSISDKTSGKQASE